MVSSVKEIFKGFKYSISQMFVVKEPEIEIEIGLPTDVKHVSHIGWDGPSGSAPSWMNGFNTGPEFAKSSIGNTGAALSPWSSLDSSESTRQQPGPEMSKSTPPSDLPPPKRKQRRKKNRPTPSPKSNAGSTSRQTRAAKSKLVEGSSTTSTDIRVA